MIFVLGFSRLRLRHKLALSLSLAALLPVAVAATVAVRVVLDSLDSGLREQTSRQLRIAMNLVLRNVERLGSDAVQLAAEPRLVDALYGGRGGADTEGATRAPSIDEVLAGATHHLPSALVQITDANGHVVATRAIGGHNERYEDLALPGGADIILRGLSYERRVTLTPVGNILVVRAVAPIVDPSFALHGVVVMSLPLDGDFCDGIKGALGADVLIHAGDGPALSSFVDDTGARTTDIEAPPEVAVDVLAGGTRLADRTIAANAYSMGYAPLKNLEGDNVGMLSVAVGRGPLIEAKTAAARSLALGAAGAFLFALLLAGFLSRRFARSIAQLHEGALAVARGDLNVRIAPVESGDEIGDLADAFATMTDSLRENQRRLAARMREIVALHDAGRAVSSVLGLEDVLRKIVDSVAHVLDARLAALWLVEDAAGEDGAPVLRIGAARAKPVSDKVAGKRTLHGEDAESYAAPLESMALEVARTRLTLRIDEVDQDDTWKTASLAAGVNGSVLAVPLERAGRVIGVLVVGRHRNADPFNDADESLIGTFADQAATAVENARLYEEVRAFSEELEKKVQQRTRELTRANQDLEHTLNELRDTQAQLLFSERMAGLGSLVAGVAHEINSPSAAIRGSVDALSANVRRLTQGMRDIARLPMEETLREEFLARVDELAPRLAELRVTSPAEVRRRRKAIVPRLEAEGVEDAEEVARLLAETGADAELDRILGLVKPAPALLVKYLQDYSYLYRNVGAIQTAIRQIQVRVLALKSYSHLDQAKIEQADIHEGIESTLIILHHELKFGVEVVRKYGDLPAVPVYVDELNQVWTNLIHNAVQALGGSGRIVIETLPPGDDGMVAVRVIDNGPGIPPDILPRIFEPFFTTKQKGEGTGLGLGIVKKIVEKHGGNVDVESGAGGTCFTVRLPVSGPMQGKQEQDERQGAHSLR